MFAHGKLHVYTKSLTFVSGAFSMTEAWEKKHAIKDQFNRASESLVLALADGARHRSAATKLRSLDYAIGSSLECAACLDIAGIKALVATAAAHQQKQRLCEITKMLIGLRKVWDTWRAEENTIPYGAEPAEHQPQPLFHHENLEVYRVGLRWMEWFVSPQIAVALEGRLWRQTDESATSILLNIAEANGRYSELDHRRFLDMAEGAAVKTAAYLDLAVERRTLSPVECNPAKQLLSRITAMLSRM
jgi:four helix bundle protein